MGNMGANVNNMGGICARCPRNYKCNGRRMDEEGIGPAHKVTIKMNE
jgi:hypothetical protein